MTRRRSIAWLLALAFAGVTALAGAVPAPAQEKVLRVRAGQPNPERLALNYQRHSTLVHRASPLPEPPKLAPIPNTTPQ